MFGHAYEGYLRHAYPYDELRPLSCDGVDTWGSYSLTLIDALDTLAVVGNHSEFRRVYQLVTSERVNFDSDINVSVFETNIRIVGGLLGAHLMAKRYLLLTTYRFFKLTPSQIENCEVFPRFWSSLQAKQFNPI